MRTTELTTLLGLSIINSTKKNNSLVFESENGSKVILTQCECEFLKDFPDDMKDYVTVGIYANNGATLYKMTADCDTSARKILNLRKAIHEAFGE